ncbi:AGAP010992-PA-like protein [Anopheles sinensis]|uniref:AGAP010992-PA-like protein n=1 Tax=Anopheles sinensis TaxID=74873 RepID=A0A084W992_ANOSI|nr:AGAP010992-PA-like protein [Anopheles sinensis]
MTRVEVKNNYKLANCTAKIIHLGSPYRYVVDFRLQSRQAVQDVAVQTVFCISKQSGPCEKAIYNRTINFCDYLRHPSSDRLLQIVYSELNRRGNLPRSCPVQAGSYGFNSSFLIFRLPTFLPESMFRLDLNFYRAPGMTMGFTSQWYGSLRKIDLR